MRIVSVGEILWDVIGENEYLGGAPLNFAAHAQKLGHEVYPLSGVGADKRGRRALDLLKARGMSTEFVQVLKDRPTGTAEVELDMEGKPTFRIVRQVAYDFVDLCDAEFCAASSGHQKAADVGIGPSGRRCARIGARRRNYLARRTSHSN